MDASPAVSSSAVGIDVAKDHFDVKFPQQSRVVTFNYDAQSLESLLEQLAPFLGCLIVIEATGGYERRLVAELVAAGHRVAIVNPRQVRDFARAGKTESMLMNACSLAKAKKPRPNSRNCNSLWPADDKSSGCILPKAIAWI